MAFLGGIGKAIGLPSTSNIIGGLTQIGGALTGVGAGVDAFNRSLTMGTQQGQNVAVERPTQTQAAETQGSGTIEITNVTPTTGSLVPGLTGSVLGAARSLGLQSLRSPIGQIGLGTGLGLGLDAISGMSGGQQIRVTRKQQSQVKQMVELIGIEQAASILGISVAEVAMIVTKKFRARGQGITAAQLRTATRVNNRIIHMHDKLKSAYGSATRRAPARRASTRVTQIKN